MFRPFTLSLLFACNLTTSKPTDDTAAVPEPHVCDDSPVDSSTCGGRPTDMVITSPEEAMDAISHVSSVTELQTVGMMIEDVALQILAQQDAGMREICLVASEDPETGTRIYEGDCAGSETMSAFVGRAEFSETDSSNGATFTEVSAYDADLGGSFELDGTYESSADSAPWIFLADVTLSYDLGFSEPVAYSLVTQAMVSDQTWLQTAWHQIDSDPDLAVRGAICFEAAYDGVLSCDDEPVGALTFVGASRWDLVSGNWVPCDGCTEVYMDCVRTDDWCVEVDE